jgi:hypothetical protein
MSKRKGASARKIDRIISEVKTRLGANSIGAIYSHQVLADRIRRCQLPPASKNPRVQIMHTLLGIELLVGKKRLICPDLATARYLSVFARLGCQQVAIPYDITRVSHIADQLESAWHQMMLLVDHLTGTESNRLRAAVKRNLIESLQREINALGPGAKAN